MKPARATILGKNMNAQEQQEDEYDSNTLDKFFLRTNFDRRKEQLLTKLYVKGEQLLSKLYVLTILFENRDQTFLERETKEDRQG